LTPQAAPQYHAPYHTMPTQSLFAAPAMISDGGAVSWTYSPSRHVPPQALQQPLEQDDSLSQDVPPYAPQVAVLFMQHDPYACAAPVYSQAHQQAHQAWQQEQDDTLSSGGSQDNECEILKVINVDGNKRVSRFNGCRCVKDTRVVDPKSGEKGAELLLEGRWSKGPLGKSTKKIPRRFKTALGVTWIKVTFTQYGGERPSSPSSPSLSDCEGFDYSSTTAMRLSGLFPP